jgi:hypothetical protein
MEQVFQKCVLFAFSSSKDLVKGRELENGRIKEVRYMDVFVMGSDVILAVGCKVTFKVSFLLDQGEVLLKCPCNGFHS